MAIYYFSKLGSDQTVLFNPLVDKFIMDIVSLSGWGSLVMDVSWGETDDKSSMFFSWEGKTVYLSGLQYREISTSNIIFTDGSKYVVGDNTAGIVNDDVANTLYGGSKADEIEGFGGNDTLYGGGGDDVLIGGNGSDVVVGGTGFDTLLYTRKDTNGVVIDMVARTAKQGVDIDRFSGIEAIRGTHLADQVIGDGRNNEFKMLGGNDSINGGAGWDIVRYGDREATAGINANLASGVVTKQYKGVNATDSLSSIEEIHGTVFSDTIVGSSLKSEDFYGYDGNDSLSGAGGNDDLYGGVGNDTLSGGDDDDILYADEGKDSYDGGVGLDEINFNPYNINNGSGVKIDLAAGKIYNDGYTNYAALATPSYEIITGVEGVMGTWLNDTITGSGADNWFIGYDGNDSLNGGTGDDELLGGSGSDTLVGGIGNDVIYSSYEDPYEGYEGFNLSYSENDKIYSGAGNDEIFLGTNQSTVYLEYQGLLNFDYINGFDGLNEHVAEPLIADKLAIRQSTLKIGDGDKLIEGVSIITSSTAKHSNASELVFETISLSSPFFQSDMTIASEAAKVLGFASAAYAIGSSALFVIDNGIDSTLYRFVATDADAAVEAGELQLLGVVTGDYHTLQQGDFMFY